jgi:hypothetical protein
MQTARCIQVGTTILFNSPPLSVDDAWWTGWPVNNCHAVAEKFAHAHPDAPLHLQQVAPTPGG